MNVYSWFRLSKKGSSSQSATTTATATVTSNQNDEEQLYGITDELIDIIKSFTLETFKNFDLQDEQVANDGAESTSGNIQKDLSDWQEKHAVLVLSRVKELSQLRFRLCPRYLKERQFWRIYFTLVKNHIAKYELHAIRMEKHKQIAIENKKESNTNGYEVEMLESRKPTDLEQTSLK
ncbi:hypothetical protein LXL04_000841 [Taraxacum kok-saghyz]